MTPTPATPAELREAARWMYYALDGRMTTMADDAIVAKLNALADTLERVTGAMRSPTGAPRSQAQVNAWADALNPEEPV